MSDILLKYTASSGNEYNLKSDGLRTKTANFHSWEFEPQGITLPRGMRVTSFTQSPKYYESTLYITGSYTDRQSMVDRLHDDFERDIQSQKSGRITWGEWYIDCFITSSDTYPDEDGNTVNDINIFCPNPQWITEIEFPSDTFDPTVSQNVTVTNLLELPDSVAGEGFTLEKTVNGDQYLVTIGDSPISLKRYTFDRITPVSGHKYLFKFGSQSSIGEFEFVIFESNLARNVIANYVSRGLGMTIAPQIKIKGAANSFDYSDLPMVFDLTDIYGEGLEPTVEQIHWADTYIEPNTPTEVEIATGMDFPYNFEYDYSPDSVGARTINIDHFGQLDFKLTFAGEDVNPYININGHIYQVYCTLGESDVLEVDSRNYTITLIRGSQRINMFDNQNKESNIFQKINSGLINVTWDDAKFDLTLYESAAEPKWRSK